jgi:glycosyltransferase involved in cell wall biosynthesis
VIAVHGMGMRAVGSRVLPWYVVETLGLVTDALALLVPSQGRYLREQEGVGRFPWRDAPEHYVPNGIRIPAPATSATRAEVRRELGLADDDVVAVMVARLAPLKGHDVLLRALARIAPDQPRLRVVLVGDGPLAGELTALAEELGITDRVVFTGLRRDVPRVLQGADMAVLPSLHEAVPISIIEEMAAGLPIVATDVGGLPDTVSDGEEGVIVPPSDVEALAAALARLGVDDELRRTMGKRGRQRAESEHSIENTTRAYERMIEAVLTR